jgi:hypothetical protein
MSYSFAMTSYQSNVILSNYTTTSICRPILSLILRLLTSLRAHLMLSPATLIIDSKLARVCTKSRRSTVRVKY